MRAPSRLGCCGSLIGQVVASATRALQLRLRLGYSPMASSVALMSAVTIPAVTSTSATSMPSYPVAEKSTVYVPVGRPEST